MDYNFWDDRTHELEINPCKGCEDYQNGECVSNGGCATQYDLPFDTNETKSCCTEKDILTAATDFTFMESI